MDDYATAHGCVNDYTSTKCRESSLALDYCNDNGLSTVIPYLSTEGKQLMAQLLTNASSKRDSLYIIDAVCILVVVLSSVFILALLVWVIKDKSRVLAIFAEISTEEIRDIIAKAESLPISESRFDQRLLRRCNGNEEKFWHYMDSSKRGTKLGSEGPQEKKSLKIKSCGKGPEEPSVTTKKPVLGEEEKEESKGSEEPEDEEQKAEKAKKEEKKREEDRKKAVKRGILSQIE